MNPKHNPRAVNRDGGSDVPPAEPRPATLFNHIRDEGDEPTPPTPLACSNGNASVPPKGPDETTCQQPEPEPEPASKPFDLEAEIRAKQARENRQPASDPFDPARLRLPQDFAANLGFKRVISTMFVGKPRPEWFVRIRPEEGYRLETMILELKDDREQYLVQPELWGALADERTCGPRLLVAAVNRKGVPFLWPVRLPGPDGKLDTWSRSAMEAANLAASGWVRMSANMDIQAYDVIVAPAQLGEPEWPDLDFRKMLEIAFRDKVIDSLDHPVLRRLRGEL